ncbi:uncharacterized protein LOC132702186 [Cylas formicarius]|uniref:uncharacterized protein LOC132702186 n=1 Tax=Cylas formicarius TaxID=197179 RepID=UPI002958A676|nr:uncharacterized protein LOC132702186 [Cylas formicarius]
MTQSTLTLTENITAASSDSALSESTCFALFGGPRPGGLVSLAPPPEVHYKPDTAVDRVDDIEEPEPSRSLMESTPKEIESSERTPSVVHSALEQALMAALESVPKRRISTENNGQFRPRHSLQPLEVPAVEKRPQTTNLNQLLYKDEKTEISLVQNLDPDKTSCQRSSLLRPATAKRESPTIKLQVSLQNTLISEEQPLEQLDKDAALDILPAQSPKSMDKLVTTRDTFPLHKNCWVHDGRLGKIILASDKIQQTSDNDFYRSSNNTVRFGPKPFTPESKSIVSTPRYSTSSSLKSKPPPDEGLSSDMPEREAEITDPSCCKCVHYKAMEAHKPQRDRNQVDHIHDCKHACCKCPKHVEMYHEPVDYVTSVPRTSSDYTLPDIPGHVKYPEFLPPPPPVPPPHPRMYSPRRKEVRQCYDKCGCCYKHGIAEPDSDYTHEDYEEIRRPSMTDLPYQNNDEYLDLVEELQETLHSRNRNRVKKAMEEFENRSRHNRPLERPIIDYEESSESEEPIIRKITELRGDKGKCCAGDQCRCKERGIRKTRKRSTSRERKMSVRGPEKPSHWTMNPTSGEWFRSSRCPMPLGMSRAPRAYEASNQCNCQCERYPK